MTLSELMNPQYDTQGLKVTDVLKAPCERCGESFTTKEDGVNFECPCGIIIYVEDLWKVEYKYRLKTLLKREALIADGWCKCPECEGFPKSGVICYDCMGAGAIERFDCNGKCWSCGPNLGKRYKSVKASISIEGCPLCGDLKTKEAFDASRGEAP